MWTTENRQRYNRDKLRYPSDVTDEEWSGIERLIPPAKTWRPPTRGRRARDTEWHYVCAEHWLPVALCSEGSAAEEHHSRLSAALEL
jgi:hypothetical protein